MSAKKVIGKTAVLFFLMMLLTGFIYTMVMTGISQLLFRHQANGSIIEVDGVKYGSELLGQRFCDPSHLWGRIVLPDVSTYTDDEGNPLMYAWASNASPASDEQAYGEENYQDSYEAAVAERVEMIKAANPDAEMDAIPVELVTCSGSGLDPHISPAAAEYQVPRLAAENDMTEDEVREIIEKYTDGKFLGIFGEETVNVLEVNLALEGILE
ncbi:MAG: K(+)-transporting ATPase subunit C [Roseburia sp.]|nr:K(+)-transporting ATPase subunit C [Roseburia sp.]